MPELAEVEFYRRRWNRARGETVLEVQLNSAKRPARSLDPEALRRVLVGAELLSSAARGKQMMFRFSRGLWLGIHLGMTGELRIDPRAVPPGKHDLLILRLRNRNLVFSDPRGFGRLRMDRGKEAPAWWKAIPASVAAPAFSREKVEMFVHRHTRSPLKAVLLLQKGFSGVGNWMADEILWRLRLHPETRAGALTPSQVRSLWRTARWVGRQALRIISPAFADPPKTWLFPHRWKKGGRCPRDGSPLERATVGGRTTAWCPRCQLRPLPRSGPAGVNGGGNPTRAGRASRDRKASAKSARPSGW